MFSWLIVQILMRALSSLPFGDYRVWWSLSDSKYAGTALLVKKCFNPKKVSFSLDPAGFSPAQTQKKVGIVLDLIVCICFWFCKVALG